MSTIHKKSVKKMAIAKKSTEHKQKPDIKTPTNQQNAETKYSPKNISNGSKTYTKEIFNERIICASIRSSEEPHLRCLMRTKNEEKYCAIHLAQKNIVDFNLIEEDILDLDAKMSEPDKIIINTAIRKISINTPKRIEALVAKTETKVNKETTMREQKVSTIENCLKENEDELEIKLLILVNDEYCNKIAELIGPVFQDITISEDQQDPITYDEIWTIKDGVKVPSGMNKYYLFSYLDSRKKIRCLSIFTIYNMINENNFIHPITMEEIPEKDIKRAKELIDLYEKKVGLFKEDNLNLSPEFKLKNRLTKLFKQFHVHSIYLEENWLLSIDDKNKLYKIIKETEKLVSNNIKSINSNLHGFKIFQKKEQTKSKHSSKKKSKATKKDDDENDSVFKLQEYIVGEWERLIEAADNSQNQIPIWILASGLSFVVPQVKQKYPDLEIML